MIENFILRSMCNFLLIVFKYLIYGSLCENASELGGKMVFYFDIECGILKIKGLVYCFGFFWQFDGLIFNF